MKKQVKKIYVDFNFNWDCGIEISKLRADLDELEKLGATHIDMEANINWDCPELNIKAKYERLETDQEFEERVNKIKQQEVIRKHIELNELDRLKKKYEI